MARRPRRPRRGRPPQRNLPAPPALRARRHRAGVPRTRRYCPTAVLGSYARRAREIDRVILAGFVPGLSTRKVGEVLLPLLGRPVSPATVSRVARTPDAACRRLPPAPSGVPFRWPSASFPTDARRSSTSSSPGARASPNGNACPTPSTARPHRRRPRSDLRRRRQRPPRRPAPRPSGHPRPALPGPQDQEHPQQDPQVRPGGRQTRPPRHHERREHHRRTPLRRPLAGTPPEGCRMPARRPRQPPRPLPIPHTQ